MSDVGPESKNSSVDEFFDIRNKLILHYLYVKIIKYHGGLAERSMALVLKTSWGEIPSEVRILYPPKNTKQQRCFLEKITNL